MVTGTIVDGGGVRGRLGSTYVLARFSGEEDRES